MAPPSIWAEPVQGPDGRMQVYVPPKPVREFLEEPTPERAAAYIQWNQQRLTAIERATGVLRAAAAAEAGAGSPAPVTSQPRIETPSQAVPDSLTRIRTNGLPLRPPPPSGVLAVNGNRLASAPPAAVIPVKVLYAFAGWCRHSQAQTPVINTLAQLGVPVTGVIFDSTSEQVQQVSPTVAFPLKVGSPELRQALEVESYPTILAWNAQGHLVYRVSGEQSLQDLVTGLRASLDPAAAAPTRPAPRAPVTVARAPGPST